MPLFSSLSPLTHPRQIFGVRFRWPTVGDWVFLVAMNLLAFRLQWWPLVVAWVVLLLRTGILLNVRTPLRSAALGLALVLAVNLIIVTALLAGVYAWQAWGAGGG